MVQQLLPDLSSDDDIPTSEAEPLTIPPDGMSLDVRINRTTQRAMISNTLIGVAEILNTKLHLSNNPINIIFPLDGSELAYFEFRDTLFKRVPPRHHPKIKLTRAAKDPLDTAKFLFDSNFVEGAECILIDDIVDHGTTSERIKASAKIDDKKLITIGLTTKVGRSHKQDVPIHEFEDLWVAGSFGMDSGKFNKAKVFEAISKGKYIPNSIEERDRIIELHQEIQIYERMCAKAFIVIDEDTVIGWSFNIEKLEEYLNLLKENCLYEGQERETVYERLKFVQEREGREKFREM